MQEGNSARSKIMLATKKEEIRKTVKLKTQRVKKVRVFLLQSEFSLNL